LTATYRIKKRYVLVEGTDIEDKIREKYIYFFGLFDFLKANIKVIKKEKDQILFSVNKKNLYKFIFILYLLKVSVKSIFRTIKEYKKYFLNIDRV